MTKITSLVVVLIVLVGGLLTAADAAAGQARWRRTRTVRPSMPPSAPAVRQRSYSPRSRAVLPSDYYYPKYVGGFHARYFDSLPSIYGTRPVRGTAW